MAKDQTFIRRFIEGWKRVGKRMGDIQARFLLILFYFVILGPFALAVRLGGDPLAIKPGSLRGWRPRDDQLGVPIERAIKQF